ncbi:hypothetical protein Tco_0704420 [Tanacetum coccineum]|uniref:Uncharacterized protein n=1 Tax=Tanacetum coccineum TaxID=301880 RepID=A0ABQ4Y1N5_9ASTR
MPTNKVVRAADNSTKYPVMYVIKISVELHSDSFFSLKKFSHTQIEYSKYLRVAEECSSSESGWTMYIVSPMHESRYNICHGYDHGHGHRSGYDHSHGHGHGHGHGHVDDGIDKSYGDYSIYHNEDSDDSMVSDTSSRPSRQAILCGSSKKRSGSRRESKHAMSQKQVEKKLHERRQRAVKEEEHKTRVDVKARKTN